MVSIDLRKHTYREQCNNMWFHYSCGPTLVNRNWIW